MASCLVYRSIYVNKNTENQDRQWPDEQEDFVAGPSEDYLAGRSSSAKVGVLYAIDNP
jgi:hypothetical protein